MSGGVANDREGGDKHRGGGGGERMANVWEH